MRVLTSPSATGAAILALPQDVQPESLDDTEQVFEKRPCRTKRPLVDRASLEEAGRTIRSAKQPLIIAGGGVIYSEATAALAQFVERSGIPVVETQAGKGSLDFDHPQNLG